MFSPQRVLALLIRIYRLLLVIYPADFRHEYSAAMLQLFRDSLQAAWRRGVLAMLQVAAHTLLDLALTAPREHISAATERVAARRAVPQTGGSSIAVQSPAIQQAIRTYVEDGVLLMGGFVVQALVWLWRGIIDGRAAMIPIAGVLVVAGALIAARLLLRVHALQRAGVDAEDALGQRPSALPRTWRRLVPVLAALYLIGVLLVPLLVPHTGELHNAMMFRWGLPGWLYYIFTGCVLFATTFLIVPFSLALFFKVCWRWRELPKNDRGIWLAGSTLLLAALELTLPIALRFAEWWID
jgi:hypothetical protein